MRDELGNQTPTEMMVSAAQDWAQPVGCPALTNTLLLGPFAALATGAERRSHGRRRSIPEGRFLTPISLG